MDDRQSSMLEYRSPGARQPGWIASFRAWFRAHGEDTFLGCSALLFASCQTLFTLVGIWTIGMGGSACIVVPTGLLATLLAVGALLERRSSKMFSAVALGLVGFNAFMLHVVGPLVR